MFDEVNLLLSESPPPISFIDELRLCLRQTLGAPSGSGSTKNSFVHSPRTDELFGKPSTEDSLLPEARPFKAQRAGHNSLTPQPPRKATGRHDR